MSTEEAFHGHTSRCRDLSEVLAVLASSAEVADFLPAELGASDATAALAMLSAGWLEGDLGDAVHNLLIDEILNVGRDAWSGLITTEAGDFPVHRATSQSSLVGASRSV